MVDLKDMMDIKDIDLNQFDVILVLDENAVNEAGLDTLMGTSGSDKRALSPQSSYYSDKGAYSDYAYYNDPKLYASWAFGKQLQNALTNIGSGYSCEVGDYGRYVSVKVTYSNPPTGKSASKTFLIVFEPDGSKGYVFSTSNRYRTFSGLSNAASYIKSASSSLRNSTQ